jgi:predicted GNAT superfamily acetyltransferase
MLNYNMKKRKDSLHVANLLDVKSVLAVQKEHLLNAQREGSRQHGFLVHSFTPIELSKIILSRKGRVYVSRGENGNAYLIGYFNKRHFNDPKIKLKIYSQKGKDILDGNYAYLRHVATAQAVHARVAMKLERRFFEDAIKRKIPYVLGEVALEPLNKTSLDFHLKNGGELIASYVDSGRITWGIIAKKI